MPAVEYRRHLIFLVTLFLSFGSLSVGHSVAAQEAVCNSCASLPQTPTANPGGPYVGLTGQTIALDGGSSWSPGGSIIYYYWDFGDGTSGSGPNPTHQYGADGVYSVSLTVCDENWSCASSQGFVTVDSVNLPGKITFEGLPNGSVIDDQYLGEYGVRFYSGNSFYPTHVYQTCGQYCSTTSPPNFLSTKPDDTGIVTVEFTQPVSNLTFYMIGVDSFFNQFAVVDVYRSGTYYGSYPVYGNGTWTVGFTFGSLTSISKIVVRSIVDPLGIGFDDFTFTVPSDVKITSGRIGGYLNGTTQNALLGADVALNARPLPGAFGGGTYSWTCTSATQPNRCSILTPTNTSSVTLQTNELSNAVGNYTVTVTYTKGKVTTSSSMTINSILPTVTGFVGHQSADRVTPSGVPGPCGLALDVWRYRLGCGSEEGISFDASVHATTLISDPAKSGIKYVQAVSTYHQYVQGGNLLCETIRSDPSNIDSGWQIDDKDPYVLTCCPVHYFSEGNDLTMHSHDYPDLALTRVTDREMLDALYLDDRFEMYLVYFTNTTPSIEHPMAKIVWNWGGLVVFQWDPVTQTTSHRIQFSNATPGIRNSVPTSSMVSMQGRAQDDLPKACQQGAALTNNLIDSSRVFVRFHYKDFLNRDPAGIHPDSFDDMTGTDLPGWKFWTSQISQCAFDFNCIRSQRINDGLAFFLSAEFVQTDPDLANPPGSPNFNAPAYNRAFVKYCYIHYLHKDPANEPDGWDFWTTNLNSNGDYRHTIDSFQVCSDYRSRQDFSDSAEKF